MINLNSRNNETNPLLRNIPKKYYEELLIHNHNTKNIFPECYKIKINLESIHYTGNNYGYGWTFVISTLKRHWISNGIHIQRGQKSLVNKNIFHKTVNTHFSHLQHLPIIIYAQHTSGFNVETTLHLQPNSFKKCLSSQNINTRSIYTGLENKTEGFLFHELHTITHNDARFMFVFNLEITPENAQPYKG